MHFTPLVVLLLTKAKIFLRYCKLGVSISAFIMCVLFLSAMDILSWESEKIPFQIRLRNRDDRDVPVTSLSSSNMDHEDIKTQPGVQINTNKSVNVSQIQQNQFMVVTISRTRFNASKPYLALYTRRGRLGNQMFQMASLVGMALKYGYIPLLPTGVLDAASVFDLTRFEQVTADITKYKHFQEGDLNQYDRDITKFIQPSELSVQVNRSIDGYFQSFKHFNHSETAIRQLFTFKDNIVEETRLFIEHSVEPETVKVGIHVRRGDFLSEYHNGLGRVTVDADYIKKAMDVYRSKYPRITFIVLSNDMAWCKEHVHDDHNKIVFSPFQHPGHDLAVMSQCDHMIVSVGTFGWWGGWLAGGSVVYFNGYPRPGSEIDKHFVKSDYYPPHWLGLS